MGKGKGGAEMKTAYDAFKHSACFDCGYCKECKLPESEAGMLDIRKNGVVKIWCYAENDVIAIMTAMEKEECPYLIKAENE
jgi:hypothetical protein